MTAKTCAICKKALSADPGRRPGPFCSESCRTIDLGHWAEGAYRVPVAELEQELAGVDGNRDLN